MLSRSSVFTRELFVHLPVPPPGSSGSTRSPDSVSHPSPTVTTPAHLSSSVTPTSSPAPHPHCCITAQALTIFPLNSYDRPLPLGLSHPCYR